MQHQDKECFVFHQHREELVTSAALAKKSQISLQHKEIDCTKKRKQAANRKVKQTSPERECFGLTSSSETHSQCACWPAKLYRKPSL